MLSVPCSNNVSSIIESCVVRSSKQRVVKTLRISSKCRTPTNASLAKGKNKPMHSCRSGRNNQGSGSYVLGSLTWRFSHLAGGFVVNLHPILKLSWVHLKYDIFHRSIFTDSKTSQPIFQWYVAMTVQLQFVLTKSCWLPGLNIMNSILILLFSHVYLKLMNFVTHTLRFVWSFPNTMSCSKAVVLNRCAAKNQ